MGFKLTEHTTERLAKIFRQRTIDAINCKLATYEDTGSDIVRVDVNVNCDDYTNFMSEVKFAFSKGNEVAYCTPLEVNKWLDIDQISPQILHKYIILKDEDNNFAIVNADEFDKETTRIWNSFSNEWISLKEFTKFMILEQ